MVDMESGQLGAAFTTHAAVFQHLAKHIGDKEEASADAHIVDQLILRDWLVG